MLETLKNTMRMGMHKIVKQMGKVNPKNRSKTLEKWLTMTPN
jgi:hypothetical protein